MNNFIKMTARRGFPLVLGVLLVVGLWNVGSYDPRHELSTFVPPVALATSTAFIGPTLPPIIELPPQQQNTCNVTASAQQVFAGASVTISWQTTGYTNVTLNGVTVSPTGSQLFANIQQNTTYTLIARTANGDSECVAVVNVICITPPPTCTLTPATATIVSGGTVTLNWTTTNASSTSLTGFGPVPNSGSRTTPALTASTTYTLTVLGQNGSTVNCTAVITVSTTPVNPPPTCTLTPTSVTIASGGTVTLDWTTTNASSTSLTGFGAVPNAGSRTTPALTASTTYTLTVLGQNGSTVNCTAVITVSTTPVNPPPTCTLSPTTVTIASGSTLTLSWNTTNASTTTLTGFGTVSSNGSIVTPAITQNTTYTLTVLGLNGSTVSCVSQVTVTTSPLPPVCVSFTANPASLPVGGGTTALNWSTSNAGSASIAGVGAVALNGSTTVSVSTTTTYVLTVTGAGGATVSCSAVVTVATPPVTSALTCAANVSLSLSPTSVQRGSASTLSWSTNGVTSVRFDNGITATGTSGSVTVTPSVTTTYTLTASTATSTVNCPVTLTVTNPPGGGGGGGGSSAPTCELSISDNRVSRGESATLRWSSSRASDVIITDSTGGTLVDTRNRLASEKERLFSGSLRVTPTTNTIYTMEVIRGSSDRTCTVRVTTDNPVVVTEVRDQPLIAGIALSQVPYTGFEAGPILTTLFYLILMLWAAYLAYLFVIRRDSFGGYQLAKEHIVAEDPTTPEEIRPDVFVKSVQAPPTPPLNVLPPNLPVGEPVIGYSNLMAAAAIAHDKPLTAISDTAADETEITALENQAHARRALLSSDAVRHLIGTAAPGTRAEALDEVIKLAKTKFPTEDGWVVINEERMRELCLTCQAKPLPSAAAPYIPATVPAGAGSLAEAIVTGNVLAAYAMIGHRPMFALADAAADLDALYRLRRGEEVTVSNLLQSSTAALSDGQIEAMIKALTGALDGTYTDEAAAVKMSIMKAIKVLA